MASRSHSEDTVIAEINVTPLVDVVLVLLIIFMITAPVIYQNAIKVQLPKAVTGEQTQKSPLQFTLDRDGALRWGNNALTFDELTQRLKSLDQKTKEETALISADEKTAHGTVVKLMDALRDSGLTHFALNVEPSAAASKATSH